MMAPHRPRALWLCATVFALLIGASPVARAQTQDDFFNPATLQDVRLTMSRRDWQALRDHADLDTYYAADLRWNGVVLRNVGIRSRGHFTRNGIKPGLRIDVNRYLSEQRFLGLTAFVLDNAYSDPSLMREALAMRLFTRVGVAAPREAHARLFINEDYAGVYTIVESIDRAFVRRAFGDDEARVEDGGHLFEYRWMWPYHFEYLGPDLESYAELFTPQTHETDSMIGIFGRLEELVRTINDAPDEGFAEAVGQHLDMPLVMRYLAVENFLAETDGLVGHWGLHNFYLYRPRDDGRASLIPWDKDSAFSAVEHPVDFHLFDNVLVRRALAVPGLRQIYVDTLMACGRLAQERDADSPDPRGWLEREIDRTAFLLRNAVADDPVSPFSLEQFDSDLGWLRDFAVRRPAVVACALGACESPAVDQKR
jgi:spore coat protein H